MEKRVCVCMLINAEVPDIRPDTYPSSLHSDILTDHTRRRQTPSTSVAVNAHDSHGVDILHMESFIAVLR